MLHVITRGRPTRPSRRSLAARPCQAYQEIIVVVLNDRFFAMVFKTTIRKAKKIPIRSTSALK